MRRLTILVLIYMVLARPTSLFGQTNSNKLIAYWSFEAVSEGRVVDETSGLRDDVEGHYRIVKGVIAAKNSR